MRRISKAQRKTYPRRRLVPYRKYYNARYPKPQYSLGYDGVYLDRVTQVADFETVNGSGDCQMIVSWNENEPTTSPPQTVHFHNAVADFDAME